MNNIQQVLLERFKDNLSPWAICIAVDGGGEVWQYSKEPPKELYGWGMPPHPFEMSRIGEINMGGVDWRETLTYINQIDGVPSSPSMPTTIDISHSHTYPLINCDCGMAFVLLGYVADTIFEQGTPPYCPYCGKSMTTQSID